MYKGKMRVVEAKENKPRAGSLLWEVPSEISRDQCGDEPL